MKHFANPYKIANSLTDNSVRFARGAWSNGGFTTAEFPATLAAPFFGKYLNLAGHGATEDSLWRSFLLFLPRLFSVSILILRDM
jgi:hypothetical protein